jgi:mannose-6-phosphate isomerase
MIWYPLKISTPLRQHVFGDHLIQEKVGKRDLPDEKVAETWEISDVEEDISVVTNVEFAGKTCGTLYSSTRTKQLRKDGIVHVFRC